MADTFEQTDRPQFESLLCIGCPEVEVLNAIRAGEQSDDTQVRIAARIACGAIRAGQDSYNGPEVKEIQSNGCGLAYAKSCANPEMPLARAILKMPLDQCPEPETSKESLLRRWGSRVMGQMFKAN